MFCNLPLEVISNHIFPFLNVNDLLRPRRVCKVSKDLAEEYLRVYGTSNRVIRLNVDEDSDDLTTFLALSFTAPATRFDLVNRDKSSWDREQMRLFLRLYGEKITHLKFHQLDVPIESPAEFQIFEGLPNLNELRIFHLRENRHDISLPESDSNAEEAAQFAPPDLNLPSTFKRLQHLNVENYSGRPQLLLAFISACSTNLERVNYPRLHNSSRFRAPHDVFEWVRRIVDTRHRENPNQPNLKYLDLERFRGHDVQPYLRSFYELVTTCSAHGVKLQNVDARLIEEVMKLDTRDRGLHEHKISRCVESIKNLMPSVCTLELTVLEKIDIERTSWCSMPLGDFEAQPWSNLKKLKLFLNSPLLAYNGGGKRVEEFFFHGIRREKLESLELSYVYVWHPNSNMASVCSSCPNLKTLRIQGWPGTDRDIAQLWGDLPLLENVTFWSCEDLGDAAFIGEDVTEPVILKATRLKSLELGSLDEMPGITDNLFQSVLRHMPLKKLYLKSDGPVSSITMSGLESLLTGKFAETIEEFPLMGKIKLDGVTDEQLAELEGNFRSSQMKCGRI